MIQHGSFWAGNLGRLKDLTHQAWGTVDEQAPLEIVISDNFNNFPFSIAFLQGRFDVARAILQIVNAHDEDAFNDSTSEPQIESQVVDKTFTINNVDQISMQGKSHATPVELIRTDIARILINADTDQSTRNLKVEDFIHGRLSGLLKAARVKPHAGSARGEELDFLNGAGETCPHTAVKKDMLSIVKALVDYNPQQVYRENAVGRTPAELAHNGLINELSAQPGRPETNMREQIFPKLYKRVQMNIEIRPLQMVKLTGSGQISRISASAKNLPTTKFEAVISNVMATAMRKQTGNGRLVTLSEANDVAGLGDTGSQYFSVESRRNEDDKVVSNYGKKDEKVDFVTIGLAIRLGSAWPEPKKGTEKSDGDCDSDSDEV
ncbi:hypothetical protein C2857_004486 [Epichloe festucae Fl1]|uniref:Uncharacterized protein n=1 Tax=Epichloe festucae (strain Fl1) TaxID=877507 RepID=A0A7S9PVB9_EPIFF|nr:hypothetical protein C2857_004486 [Epichloe festucae Fl1]